MKYKTDPVNSFRTLRKYSFRTLIRPADFLRIITCDVRECVNIKTKTFTVRDYFNHNGRFSLCLYDLFNGLYLQDDTIRPALLSSLAVDIFINNIK